MLPSPLKSTGATLLFSDRSVDLTQGYYIWLLGWHTYSIYLLFSVFFNTFLTLIEKIFRNDGVEGLKTHLNKEVEGLQNVDGWLWRSPPNSVTTAETVQD